ncbi:hypothetical protein D3C81_1517640 [compost metagenome]
MAVAEASGAAKGRFRSGLSVSTMAAILDGSTRKTVSPIRSVGLTSGIGTRAGGRAVP